jgi:hypothetical protein
MKTIDDIETPSTLPLPPEPSPAALELLRVQEETRRAIDALTAPWQWQGYAEEVTEYVADRQPTCSPSRAHHMLMQAEMAEALAIRYMQTEIAEASATRWHKRALIFITCVCMPICGALLGWSLRGILG